MVQKLLCHFAGIALAVVMTGDHAPEFRTIYVDMDTNRFAAEHRGLSNNAVVESGPNGHDQIAFRYGFIGVGGTMHSEHAERERVRFRECALA